MIHNMNAGKKIFGVAVFFAVIGVAIAVVFEMETSARAQRETVTILRGENALQIASDLKSEGIIKSKLVFLFETIRTGNLRKLKSGEYDLKGLGYGQILDKLVYAKTVAKTITVVPGWDIKDIAGRLVSSGIIGQGDFMEVAQGSQLKKDFGFLADLPEKASLEGYLYPDTYQIPEKPSADDLARLMLDNFDKKLSPELRDEITKQNKRVFDIMTMAAMIEREVITEEDKKTVSGILWKRLDAGMPLQVDSTLLYFKATSSQTIDKDVDSTYNTYKYSGLPAGPICNPGIESIEAAIYPQESPYWYYLSAKDGTTIFSKNYGDHLINKAKYLD
jgi:UPF0755 protein